MFDNAEIVAEGTWIYAERHICYLRIIKWNVIYGSGDYEDSPEICDDKEEECYYIQFESVTEKGDFNSQTGAFFTVNEAMTYADEVTCQKVNWINTAQN